MATDDQTVAVGERLPVRTRTIAPGVEWLSSCAEVIEPDEVIHIHNSSAFLIVGGSASLLVDVGSAPFAAEIEARVRELTGPRGLQWIFPTHLEHPHAGGLPHLAEAFPEATVLADTRDYDFYFPDLHDRIRNVSIGDEIDLGGGYRFTFLKAVFKDLVTTLWGYESSQQIMFVSDGFSFTHREGEDIHGSSVHAEDECTMFLSELPRFPSVEEAAILNRAAMWWTHHRSIDPFVAEMRELLERYPSRLLAPAHGGMIDDAESFIPIMKAGCDIAYESGAH